MKLSFHDQNCILKRLNTNRVPFETGVLCRGPQTGIRSILTILVQPYRKSLFVMVHGIHLKTCLDENRHGRCCGGFTHEFRSGVGLMNQDQAAFALG